MVDEVPEVSAKAGVSPIKAIINSGRMSQPKKGTDIYVSEVDIILFK